MSKARKLVSEMGREATVAKGIRDQQKSQTGASASQRFEVHRQAALKSLQQIGAGITG